MREIFFFIVIIRKKKNSEGEIVINYERRKNK